MLVNIVKHNTLDYWNLSYSVAACLRTLQQTSLLDQLPCDRWQPSQLQQSLPCQTRYTELIMQVLQPECKVAGHQSASGAAFPAFSHYQSVSHLTNYDVSTLKKLHGNSEGLSYTTILGDL